MTEVRDAWRWGTMGVLADELDLPPWSITVIVGGAPPL